MATDRRDFDVELGETFMPTIRWATEELMGIPITAVSQSAPVTITAIGHLVPPGWDVAVVSVRGPTEINATRYPPQGKDWHPATIINDYNVQLNDVNTADFPAYISGGYLVYQVPMKLTGISAEMKIYDAPGGAGGGGAVLATLSSALGSIVLDLTNKTIVPRLETAGLTWNTGYYELMMTDVSLVAIMLLEGEITIE